MEKSVIVHECMNRVRARVVAFLVRPVDATYFACLLADNGLEGSPSGTALLCVPVVDFW